MPALNFTMFVEKVESGEKRQTIRRVRKRPIKVGDTLHLFTGMRTKACRKLGEVRCESVEPAEIHPSGFMRVGGAHMDCHEFARADGFSGWVELLSWFEKTHGLPFEGVLIKWGALTPATRQKGGA